MNDFDITDIEKAVTETIRSLGFPRVWNNRPKAVDDTINDFVVVKVSGGITDKAAFGLTRLAISIFVRDVQEMKNSKRLSVLQKGLEQLPLWIGDNLLDGHPRIVGDTPDDFGFHARIITYLLYIKATT